jgi:hypothetical protein
MAKPMRICDQDLIINKVMETINKQNSLAKRLKIFVSYKINLKVFKKKKDYFI